MSEQEFYKDLLIKMKDIKNNLKDAIYYINLFSENSEQGLKINDSVSYTNSAQSVKNELDNKITKLNEEIIPFIESKS